MDKKDYLYFEPRTGIIFAARPERRNVYQLEATDENRAQLEALTGDKLTTWLEANEVL